MISGKFWLFPDGSVHNVGAGEHAQLAKDRLLCLPDGTTATGPRLFAALSRFESRRAFARGATGEALKWLETRGDPRVYVIDRWKWVRTVGPKFYAHDKESLAVVAQSIPFWAAQSGAQDEDTLDFYYASGHEIMTVQELAKHVTR